MLIINRVVALLLHEASPAVMAGPFSTADKHQPVPWITGGSVSTITCGEFESFLVDCEVTDRALP